MIDGLDVVLPADVRSALERCVEVLAPVPGVAAVVLGGSWAVGTADEQRSDVDLGVLYRSSAPPSTGDLCAAAAAVDDGRRTDAVTPFGAWGPFIDGGAWLVVGGRRVDWLLRDVERVGSALDECRAGRAPTYYQAGHPHGFRLDIYAAEVAAARPLHDPDGVLAALRARIDPYPPALRAETVRAGLWEAGFSLDQARGPARRGNAHHVSGCLYRATTCLGLALLAHGETWCANEKAVPELLDRPGLAPPGFAAALQDVLAAPGSTPAQLVAAVDAAAALRDAAGAWCGTVSG